MTTVKEWILNNQAILLEDVEEDIGIEIEVEGRNLPAQVGNLWRVDRDGSLRGESYEYVSKPIKYSDTVKALNQLWKAYASAGSVVDESIRAGVHVHRNVQKFTGVELFNLATSYFAIEPLMMKWAGESRQGNHFCLQTSDAEGLLFALARVADTRNLKHINTDNLRYASLNFLSLFKYGTVEFRGMRGTGDQSAIKQWTDMVWAVTENCKRWSDPIDIIQSMSGDGEESLLRRLLPDHWSLLQFDGWQNDIRESVRRLQMMAFATDWSNFNDKIKPKESKSKVIDVQIAIAPGALANDQRMDVNWAQAAEELRRHQIEALAIRDRNARIAAQLNRVAGWQAEGPQPAIPPAVPFWPAEEDDNDF